MEEKKLKINIPEGYEIDREKSTFEEIVFKKVEDPLAKLPKTWEEYYKRTKGYISYYCYPIDNKTHETKFDGFYNEFSTKERVKQYVALGKLLQLRDYWVGNWKDNSNNSVAVIYHYEDEIVNTNVSKKRSLSYSLTFPTKERVKQYVALGKLLQLRDYWVGDWKINSDIIYVIYKNVIMATMPNSGFPLTFPTREMAKEFKNCFEDLIKEAYPLV